MSEFIFQEFVFHVQKIAWVCYAVATIYTSTYFKLFLLVLSASGTVTDRTAGNAGMTFSGWRPFNTGPLLNPGCT